jgi:putative helicase
MAHFQPEFWLGMTATPERTDDKDVFKIFNHQIAYEIRLKDALDYNLLCPFHYHGISDLKINNEEQKDFSNFAYLTSDERVKHVLQKAEEFKFSGERVKGLIFCSSVDEAKVLSEKLNQHNLRTTYLTGDSKPEARLAAVDRLAGADGPQALDYILTVDIFNEGVDIPEINQVIFLRPTQSPIIFTQQLGRGLRKAAGKEYVVILDFIANYEKNYLIPVALSGDNSYDKDSMRKLVMLGTKVIPGASTVEFEKVVRDRVLESIDNARTNTVELLRTSYQAIKNKLGRIPNLVDFYPHNGIDAVKFFEKKWAHYGSSYYGFLAKYEKDYTGKLSPLQAKMLSYLSGRFGNGKRVAEALLIESIINNKNTNADFFKEQLLKRFGIDASDDLLKNIVLNLSNQFNLTGDQKERNKDVVFVEPIGTEDFRIADAFNRALNDETSSDFIVQLNDLIAFIYQRYDLRYSKRYRCMDLTLNEKYSYEDIPRLLNWSKYISAQIIGGYRYDDETNTLPVLVNYNKEDDAIAYEDHFENEEYLIALSKTNRKVDSKDAEIIFRKQPEYKNTKILLFVRKNKNDSETKTFYFLGEMNAAGDPEPVAVPKRDGTGGKLSAFKVRYRLESNVRRDIYEYITES